MATPSVPNVGIRAVAGAQQQSELLKEERSQFHVLRSSGRGIVPFVTTRTSRVVRAANSVVLPVPHVQQIHVSECQAWEN